MKTTPSLLAAFAVAITTAAHAATVVSLSDQRGGDLNSAVNLGALDYNQLKSQIIGAGHTVLPGIASATAANLAGADVFFNGTGSHVYSAGELADIRAFIAAGGCAIIEVNSASSEQATGNQIMNALGLGNPFTSSLGSGSGTFANVVTSTTVGPAGDLRGASFEASFHSIINPGAGTTVGTTPSGAIMVEYVGLGLGSVLAVGDPLGFDLFTTPAGGQFNANNANAYLNFIAGCDDHEGVPDAAGTSILLALGGLSLLGLRRMARE